MTTAHATITAILEMHGIAWRIVGQELHAADVYTVSRNGQTRTGRRWVNVGTFTRGALFAWLGY